MRTKSTPNTRYIVPYTHYHRTRNHHEINNIKVNFQRKQGYPLSYVVFFVGFSRENHPQARSHPLCSCIIKK